MPRRLPLALALALAPAAALPLGGCGYVPARFADRPPVLVAGDNAPIPVPRRRRGFNADSITDLHLRNVLVEALEPERVPEAGDVNALDEVPRSSWFRPPAGVTGDVLWDAEPAPELPLTALPPEALGDGVWPPATAREALTATREGAVIAALDALGRPYVLRRDPPEYPRLRTAAEAAAARLVRAVGYLTPRVDVLEITAADLGGPPERARAFLAAGAPPDGGRYRIGATRWPVGIDLGPTLALSTRRDDPNDRIPHRDRRTLRALGMLAGWLRLNPLDPEHLRDVYVGVPRRGHVQHHLLGLHVAFGAALVGLPPGDGAPMQRLITLGLTPEPDPTPVTALRPGLGEITSLVVETDITPSPPFAPLDRALPADNYWAAKRIAALPAAAIAEAVAAGRLADPLAAAWLAGVLEARRAQISIYAYGQVTPCEVEAVSGGALVLRDLGVAEGHWSAADSRYRAELLSSRGDELAPARWFTASSATVRVPLPRASDYMVVRVQVVRSSGPPTEDPRPLEVHLVGGGNPGAGWRVRGIRH